MGQTLVTLTARSQIRALDGDGRNAVEAAIENLSEENGEPIDLPVRGGARYLAVQASGENTPVVIYRAVSEGEGGGWLILSLMSPDEYKDVLQLREFLAGQPGARSLIEMTAEAILPRNPRREGILVRGPAAPRPAVPPSARDYARNQLVREPQGRPARRYPIRPSREATRKKPPEGDGEVHNKS